jgi:hypothetical protein
MPAGAGQLSELTATFADTDTDKSGDLVQGRGDGPEVATAMGAGDKKVCVRWDTVRRHLAATRKSGLRYIP